jgi:hypothetical protein
MVSAIVNEISRFAKEVSDYILHWRAYKYQLRRNRKYHNTNLWKF